MVQYTDYSLETIYNPAFGDYDEETKCIDDLSVTNNNNGVKVSATVDLLFMTLLKNIRRFG